MKANDKKRRNTNPKITIKRQKPNHMVAAQIHNYEQSHVSHVRRHSVMASRNTDRMQERLSHNKEKQFGYPLSYQSSKQIKSLFKYKPGKYEKCHEQGYLYENEKTEKFATRNFQGLGTSHHQHMNRKNYDYLTMIGKGGFGKVWRVRNVHNNTIYALKQMSKATIIAKRSVDSILNQRHLLSNLRHQFLVNMIYAFQDHTMLYLLMNIMEGGDLRYHLAKKHKFNEYEARFITATIILAIEYLHNKMIIHRDIKPENIVFDSEGYPHLTDLGIAKYIREQNYQDTSGTPGYMAPEVMFHHNHRYEVDYFAIGVILYQIMMGKRPYLGRNRQQIKQLILTKQVLIRKKDIPDNWTIEAADFVNKLLQRKPIRRLGWGGIQQIKNHRWLKDFPWGKLESKQLQSPFNQKYYPEEVRYRTTELETQFKKLLNKNQSMLERGNLQDYFSGYTYEGLTESYECCKSTFLH